MNEFLIYLCLPPYLAQWYAHECTQVHYRDKAVCPRDIYQFPTPVVPIHGSQEADVIQMHLTKQPSDVPAAVPADATIAITIPSFPYKPVAYYNYMPESGLEHLADTIRYRFKVELFEDIHEARRKVPQSRIDLLINAWMIIVSRTMIPTSIRCSKSTKEGGMCIAKRPSRRKNKKIAISIGQFFDNHSFLFHVIPLYSISS